MTLSVLDTAVADLEVDEAFRADLYLDTRGVSTIGYGTSLRAWSEKKALAVLSFDAAVACTEVQGALPWASTLSTARMAVLVEMSYNLGITGLLGFQQFLAHLHAGDWSAAGLQLTASLADHEEPARVARWVEKIANG